MKSMRKGFTLIELMIVIAIIAIIAAIAIPNLMQSRIRANEAAAVTAIKNYTSAQVTYQVGKQGRDAANAPMLSGGNPVATSFCTNFRVLFYGHPVAGAGLAASVLQLISKAHADAFSIEGGTANAATSPAATVGAQAPYQGYLFREPSDFVATDWNTNFAQLAFPANSTNTGNNAYWVGQQGTVWMIGLANGLSGTTAGDTAIGTPSTVAGSASWITL